MNNRWFLTLFFALFCAVPGFAQTSWHFRWQKGDVLTYKVKHLTNVAEVVDNRKTEAISQLDLVKRWQVVDVDAQGIATLEMTLLAMRNEQKRPSGDALLFDSENPEKSTPELREQMAKYVGKTLTILRIDQYGRVHQVKLGSASRYNAEPPFIVVFPDAKPAVGQNWTRPYTLVMEPPQGTGEKYQAEQVYECKKLDAGKALLSMVTRFKTAPDNMADRLPLLQKDLQGEVVVDLQAGRLVSSSLHIDKTIENHQGKNSSYRFQSQYSEVLVQEK